MSKAILNDDLGLIPDNHLELLLFCSQTMKSKIIKILCLCVCFVSIEECSLNVPSLHHCDDVMSGRNSWAIGKDMQLMVQEKLYFYPEAYVFGKGKVCNCILYCTTNRGDTIAAIDSDFIKQDVDIASVKLYQCTVDFKTLMSKFNGSFTQSRDFLKVFNAVDSLYLADFD
jgi:hypothetical protein